MATNMEGVVNSPAQPFPGSPLGQEPIVETSSGVNPSQSFSVPSYNARGPRTGIPLPIDDPITQEYFQKYRTGTFNPQSASSEPYDYSQRVLPGTRYPVRNVQPGQRIHGRSSGIPVTTGEDEKIAAFIASRPGCGSEQDIRRFIELIRTAEWNGIDATSVIRTIYLAGLIPQKGASSLYRVANMSFTDETQGTRGKRENDLLPSLLWTIASRECGSIPQLNAAIEEVIRGEFGFEVPYQPDQISLGTPDEQARYNEALAYFFSINPQCTAHREDILRFLNLVDSHHLNARDIFSLMRTLSLEGRISPIFTSSRTRSAGLSLNPLNVGVRGNQRDAIKFGLLWKLLEQYCGQMQQIVQDFNNVLTHQIQLSVQQGAIPEVPKEQQ